MKVRLDKLSLFKDLDYEPHAGQLAVHLSQAPRRVLACGVRWGKTHCAALEALAAAMEPREESLGWIAAPAIAIASIATIAMTASERSERLAAAAIAPILAVAWILAVIWVSPGIVIDGVGC